MIKANNPNLVSWVTVPEHSDFPIQNLPLGVFKTDQLEARVGMRIGDSILDLKTLHILGYLENLPYNVSAFDSTSLNLLMKKGKLSARRLRDRVSDLLNLVNTELQNNQHHVEQVLISVSSAEVLMPIEIGDYTDFYSSKEHATNVGTMFRDPNNALLPNWLWIPVGYHGRSSSVIPSGQAIHRPKGQTKPNDDQAPIFGPSKMIDFELEMAFVTFDGKALGDTISTAEAEDYIFGLVLFNDWSARDIQKWEYVPLGPFLAKNFASSISSWIVSLDALQPYSVDTPSQDPEVLDYLRFEGQNSYDINLQVAITPDSSEETIVCNSNFKYMYWNMAQQLAHHTINGCNIRGGDLLGSGTISGPTPDSYGSMLELAWKGTKPVPMSDGTERKFIQDGDTVTMRGYCKNDKVRIGFGEVASKLLPSK
ncbi:MAG: fumarylacetoacetase [Crocinitomicaceae bacterium]|jgi:fumarylacetoacetase|tara:strand:+ start:27077 stop:28348 length:1272 start_codon:yes stop_codon:yes gene_type:complete